MESIQLMQQYVERQNKVWLALEMDKGRGVDLADVEDPRVDLCLFCIQAHRLRPVDLRSAHKAAVWSRVAFALLLASSEHGFKKDFQSIEGCVAMFLQR